MQCGKVTYVKKKYAKQKIKKLQSKRHVKLRAYRCESCGLYHITSKVSLKDKEYYRENNVNTYKYIRKEKKILRELKKQEQLEGAKIGYTLFPYKSKSIINTTRQRLYIVVYGINYVKNIYEERY